MKSTFDTNILVSGVIRKGKPNKLLDYVVAEKGKGAFLYRGEFRDGEKLQVNSRSWWINQSCG